MMYGKSLRIRVLTVLLVAVAITMAMSSTGAAAVITVTTTADSVSDDGLCSLREAIVAANTDAPFMGCAAGSGADSIAISPALGQAVTFVLTRDGSAEDDGLTGDLDVSGTLELNVAGRNVTVDGNAGDRVLHILPYARVTISGLTVQNGNAGDDYGGGIAIDQGATLTVTTSSVISSTALGGGGIANTGRLVAIGSLISGNQGGGIRNNGGSVELRDSTVSADLAGYGVGNENGGYLLVSGGEIVANQGGGVYNFMSTASLSGVRVIGNTEGGGVANGGPVMARLTVSRCIIEGNSGDSGAGIMSSGVGAVANIYETRIMSNTATTAGGGILNNGTMTVNGSTIAYNQARSGGGIDHWGGSLSLTNDTISSNRAGDNGGGLYNRSSAVLTHVTLSANTANGPNTGGNIFNDSTQLTLKNSIIAYSDADGNCFNSEGIITSSGHNLESANTCGLNAAGDLINTDPRLGALADNGGPTPTHALLADSPAIDAAGSASCTPTDQRGVLRPQGPACDIGAFEYEPTTPQVWRIALPIIEVSAGVWQGAPLTGF